jgi:PKD repeat protein
LGKKDIFITRYENSGWAEPIRLDPPINSSADDFGIYVSEDFSSGYFSSNRSASDDIYRFHTIVPQLTRCDTMKENLYCFEFWDELAPDIDTLPVFYEWEFSDGSKVEGLVVEHCFPGAGKYWAKLNIIDNSTDTTYTTQTSMEFEIVDHIQPFITCRDTMTVNSPESFSGAYSFLPGFTIEKYIWEFGDDSFVTGIEANHMYEEPGTYYVKLGLLGSSALGNKEIKCVIKEIVVVSDTN